MRGCMKSKYGSGGKAAMPTAKKSTKKKATKKKK